MARTRERLDSYTLELHRHGLESVEREVRWLNELIASERQAGSEPGTAVPAARRKRHVSGHFRELTGRAAPAAPLAKEQEQSSWVRYG